MKFGKPSSSDENQQGSATYGAEPGSAAGATQKKRHPIRTGCLGLIGLLILIIVIVAIATSGDKSNNASPSTGSSSTSQSASQGTTTSTSSSASVSSATTSSSAPGSVDKSAIDATYGTFRPITKSGTGDAVIPLPSGAKGGIVKAKYLGSDNFIIEALDSTNQPTAELGLPNAIGSYKGTSLFGDLSSQGMGNAPTKLQVQTSGSWTITISPVSDAPVMTAAGATGIGDAVYLYAGGAATMNVTNKSTQGGNFVVTQVGELSGAQVNEIGNYAGQVPFVSGTQPLTITSDGTWTIKP